MPPPPPPPLLLLLLAGRSMSIVLLFYAHRASATHNTSTKAKLSQFNVFIALEIVSKSQFSLEAKKNNERGNTTTRMNT